MSGIQYSVGAGGINHPDDVRTIQKLINEHTLTPLASLDVNGLADDATITAIRHFQSVYVGMKYPDGRVDPSGKTIKKLVDVQNHPQAAEKEEQSETPTIRRENDEWRRKFVRPQVKENPVTTKIIDTAEPHFRGVNAVVISGFLNDKDLFWKVNYHWEYLLWMIEHALTLDASDTQKKELRNIKSILLSCKPDPDVGYRDSPTLGKPEDRSTLEQFDTRYKILKDSKRKFKEIFDASGLQSQSKRDPHTFDLAVAPVSHPGKSKHGTGYALDIQGDNQRIKTICKQLGATLIFDEKSHVHVEFKNGVKKSS